MGRFGGSRVVGASAGTVDRRHHRHRGIRQENSRIPTAGQQRPSRTAQIGLLRNFGACVNFLLRMNQESSG